MRALFALRSDSILGKTLFVRILAIGWLAWSAAGTAYAQQKIGYVDSDYILGKIPEFATIQQNIDRQTQEWEKELEESQKGVDEMFREYQARELLYTNEERKRKRDEIMQAEQEMERLRMRYFGPDGELYTQQDNLMRPLQERVLEAIEKVAAEEGFDYIFDKSGDFLFLFAREQHNLSDRVLEELGIDLETSGSPR
jgi:outer membrane protein